MASTQPRTSRRGGVQGNQNAAKTPDEILASFQWANGTTAVVTDEFQRDEIRKELGQLTQLIGNWKRRNKPAEAIARAEALRSGLLDRLLAAARTSSLGPYTSRGLQISNAAVDTAVAVDEQAAAEASFTAAISWGRSALDAIERAGAAQGSAFQRAVGAASSAVTAARDAMAGEEDHALDGNAGAGVEVDATEPSAPGSPSPSAPAAPGAPAPGGLKFVICGRPGRNGPCRYRLNRKTGKCRAHGIHPDWSVRVPVEKEAAAVVAAPEPSAPSAPTAAADSEDLDIDDIEQALLADGNATAPDVAAPEPKRTRIDRGPSADVDPGAVCSGVSPALPLPPAVVGPGAVGSGSPAVDGQAGRAGAVGRPREYCRAPGTRRVCRIPLDSNGCCRIHGIRGVNWDVLESEAEVAEMEALVERGREAMRDPREYVGHKVQCYFTGGNHPGLRFLHVDGITFRKLDGQPVWYCLNLQTGLRGMYSVEHVSAAVVLDDEPDLLALPSPDEAPRAAAPVEARSSQPPGVADAAPVEARSLQPPGAADAAPVEARSLQPPGAADARATSISDDSPSDTNQWAEERRRRTAGWQNLQPAAAMGQDVSSGDDGDSTPPAVSSAPSSVASSAPSSPAAAAFPPSLSATAKSPMEALMDFLSDSE